MRPIRVLQVVSRMDRGGAEMWLMHVLTHIDRQRFHMDFVTDERGSLDSEIEKLQSAVFDCQTPRQPWRYSAQLERLIETHGPYDVVHSHVHHYNGLVMRSAARCGVPTRIVHSHSDTRRVDCAANSFRQLHRRLGQRWIGKYATRGLGVSRAAASCLFGEKWEIDKRMSVLYCGVDIEALNPPSRDRAGIRTRLGFPVDSRVFAHVGRFVKPKNHKFLIEIFEHIARIDENARFVLAGDGPLRPEIEVAIRRAGIAGRTVLMGVRSDIPRLMADLVDVLLLPSLWEGLPIVLIESQAAGVPFLCSDAVTAEADECPDIAHRLPLDQPAEVWAREAMAIARSPLDNLGRSRLARGRFDIQVGVKYLQDIYAEAPYGVNNQHDHLSGTTFFQ